MLTQFSRLVWGNIRKYQYLNSMCDEMLASILGVSPRSLYNYDRMPDRLSIGKIEAFISATGIDAAKLIQL